MKRQPKRSHQSILKRIANRNAYNEFWHHTMPERRYVQAQAALVAARAHDDERRARKGLEPRSDDWWRQRGLALP